MLKKLFAIILFLSISIPQLFSQYQSDFYNINTIQEIRITFKEHNWDAILDSLFELGTDERLVGNITINGHAYENVGIRYKGYSSWSADQVKNPFYIKLDECVKHANYEGFSKLKLSNITHDPSCIREALSYEIARKYMPAGRANFANVYVNDTLIGLYTNVEAVDDNFTQLHFESTGNSFIKGSPRPLVYPYGDNANLSYHGTDSTDYLPYYELESTYGWTDLIHLINVLNNDTSILSQVLNIDRTLWMHAFDYTLVNLDSYIGYSQNYYLYKDDNGIFNPIIWDLNMSFGSFRFSDATNTNLTMDEVKQLNPLGLLYSTSTLFSSRPLIKNVLLNSTYRKMYLAHMRTIINENFINNEYYNLGTQYQDIIRTSVQDDPNKFFSYSYFVKNIDTIVGPVSNQYPGIKNLMEARIALLDSFPGFHGYPNIIEINHSPETPVRNTNLLISAKLSGANKVILAYRYGSNDIFQKKLMFDDGSNGDSIAGDSIYSAQIIPTGNTIQYYIYAENDSAGIFSPERAEYEFYTIQPKIIPGVIAINEFNTKWIELFNNTKEDYNLSGLYLSDDKTNCTKWAIPDTVIKAKQFLIIWSNEETTSSIMHTNIDLSSNGGSIILSYNNQDIVDSISYGELETGKSIGRYPNGVGSFVYMQPTFSSINSVGTSQSMDFLLFPNPARENVFVEFENNRLPYSIVIINTNGQTLFNNEYSNGNSTMSATGKMIDISNFNEGVYFIKILYKDNVITKKLVIY